MKIKHMKRTAMVTLTYVLLASNIANSCPLGSSVATQATITYALEQPSAPSRAVQTGVLTVRADDRGTLKQIRIARAARKIVSPGVAVHGTHVTSASDLPLYARLAPKDPRAMRGSTAPPAALHQVPTVRVPQHSQRALGTMSVNLGSPYLTGMKTWWTYLSGPLVGVGHYDFNVSTGNLVIRATDMAMKNKTLPISFMRAYNSQSQHDYANTDGSVPSNYGEGWTNSFDAHISANSAGGLTIFDGTGAQFDYTPNGSGGWNPPAGVHAQLTLDQCTCDYLWWLPNGTVYHFKNPTQGGSTAALAGRLDSVYGRNRNAYLTFTYSFTNGDASSSANLSQIVAKTDDGRSATLDFADFTKSGGGSYRLLSTLKWPDGTTVTYHYDGYGNLTQVDEPGNNAGTTLSQGYTYDLPGTYPHLINLVLSPRYFQSNNTDGGYRLFDFNTATRKLIGFCYHGWANPQITDDGVSSGPLQPAPAPTGIIDYRDFTVTYNTGDTTVTDTTGHKVVFTYDSSNNRITQVAGYLGNGTAISTSRTYDTNNNLISVRDPRGNETDMQYDASGNLVAAAKPSATSSGAAFRPTSYIGYDSNNNPTAICDPAWSHRNGHDWTATPAPSDTLCPATNSVGNTRLAYTYPSYEPNGEVTQVTTPDTASAPSGYTRTMAYPSSGDQGLPTSVSGSGFSQSDGSNWTPSVQLSYDAAGNTLCLNRGNGWYVAQYDGMGRVTAIGDPDDKTIAGCGKSGTTYTTASYIQYYPNGQLKLAETPAQHANGNGVTYTYDADGDLKTVTHHFVGTNGNTTTYWYDAGDRVVEVRLPRGTSNEYYAFNWLRRYYYDLTGPQTTKTVTIGTTTGLHAYGGLYEIQEYLQGATQSGRTPTGTAAWTNVSGQTYDALDRAIASYDLAASSAPQRTRSYDATGEAGLLSSVTDGLNQTSTPTYDALRMTGITFSGDGGVTPARSYTFDADNRVLSATSTGIGTQNFTYDDAGEVTQMTEPSGSGITSPGTLTYGHYPNGARQTLSVTSTGFSHTNLHAISYRPDGLQKTLTVALMPNSFSWTYTDAGRLLTRSDPYTGSVISGAQSPYTGSYTLSALTKTYDSYGRVATEKLPMTGQYTNFTYDPEGEVTSYLGFYAPGDTTGKYGTMQANYGYSARGELVDLHHMNSGTSQFNPAWPHYDMSAANGFLYPQPEASASPPPTFTFDAFDGFLLKKNQSSNSSQKAYSLDVIGRQKTATLSGGTLSGSYTRTYDVEDHLLSQAYTTYTTPSLRPDCVGNDADDAKYTGTHTYTWGPNGRPIKMDGETLHWDGNMLLYTSNASGTVDSVKTGLLADSSPGLAENVVYDRDDSGVVVSNHNSTGFSGWTPPDPYGQRCPAGAPPSSTTYAATYVNSSFGPQNAPASDGITDGYNVIQGAHSYDSKTGQWVSRDAFASDKPYRWNHDNALRFTDPSGTIPRLSGADFIPYDPSLFSNMTSFGVYVGNRYAGNPLNLPVTHAFVEVVPGGGFIPTVYEAGPVFMPVFPYAILVPQALGDTISPSNYSDFQLVPPPGVSTQAFAFVTEDVFSQINGYLQNNLVPYTVYVDSNSYVATGLQNLGYSADQIARILGPWFGSPGSSENIYGQPIAPANPIILDNGLSLQFAANAASADAFSMQGQDYIL